jgi:tol-pal system protein YbgF
MESMMPTALAGGQRPARQGTRKVLAAAVLAAFLAPQEAEAQMGLNWNLFGGAKNSRQDITQAQATDAATRVLQLEEEVRRLNGQVEELNFQLLQLQEMIRKMQEDNEFRFQELEGGKRGALPGAAPGAAGGQGDFAAVPDQAPATELPGKTQPSAQAEGNQLTDGIEELAGAATGAGNGVPATLPGTIEDIAGATGVIDGTQPGAATPGGLEPRTLGTLTLDDNGNVVEAAPGDPVDLSAPATAGAALPAPGGAVDSAALAPSGEGQSGEAGLAAGGQDADPTLAGYPADPAQLYELGYDYVEAGDYKRAEAVFRDFTGRFPEDPRIADASFWLGESIFAQRRYEEAAKIFLDSHKKYPQSRMGAQNLLKLGVSLAGMNQRELACATFAEIPNKYPDMSNAVRDKIAAEQKATNCTVN